VICGSSGRSLSSVPVQNDVAQPHHRHCNGDAPGVEAMLKLPRRSAMRTEE
jgi:hypothetical protein